jgi:Zn-dependent M16 (insulinase) family peptidase
MKEYFLAITKEDIIEIADYIEEIVSHASLVVIGNKKSINKHKELFDEIVELKL